MDRLMAMNTFIRVIETGSFSAAARHLRVGQPAVSKAIAQLEERLGVRLLSRTTRGLSPTDAGVSFYEGAKRAVTRPTKPRTRRVALRRRLPGCCASVRR